MAANTQANNGYSQIQVGALTYLNNYYDYVSQGGTIEWSVPCGTNLAWGCWDAPETTSSTDVCELCYNVPTTFDASGWEQGDPYRRVRAFPTILLGSLNGRDSSWGVGAKTGCFYTGELAQTGRCNGLNSDGSDDLSHTVYDMRDVNAATSLPVKYSDLNSSIICFDYEENCNGTVDAVDNLFLDSYFHYIGDSALWPDGYQTSWGELNKINGNKTSAWNLNVWFCRDIHPNSTATTAWTGGGVMLSSFTLPSGQNVSINCKHERGGHTFDEGCGGGFFYIGVILNPQECGAYCLDYQELADYVGSQLFKDHVLNNPACLQIWNDLGNPPFIVDEPQNYVLDGLALGNEIWFSETNQLTCNCFKDVSFFVNGSVYGKTSQKVTTDCLACSSITTTVNGATSTNHQINCGETKNIIVELPPEPNNLPYSLYLEGLSSYGTVNYQSVTTLANGNLAYTFAYTANSTGCNGIDPIVLKWSPTGDQAGCTSCNLFNMEVGECADCGLVNQCVPYSIDLEVGQSVTVTPSMISNNPAAGTIISNVTAESNWTFTSEAYQNPNIVITAETIGQNVLAVELSDGLICNVTVNIVETTTGGGGDCLPVTMEVVNGKIVITNPNPDPVTVSQGVSSNIIGLPATIAANSSQQFDFIANDKICVMTSC